MDDNTRDRINKIIEKEAPALHNKIIDLLEKNGIQANIITASTLVYIGIANQLELGFAPNDLKKSIANLIDRLYREEPGNLQRSDGRISDHYTERLPAGGKGSP